MPFSKSPIFSLFILIAAPFFATAQTTKLIKLKMESAIALHHYHVEKVTDARQDTNTIGTMRAGLLNKTTPINLQNGVQYSFSRFLEKAVEQNENTTPIELKIAKLQIGEKTDRMGETAEIQTAFSFVKDGQEVIKYEGSASFKTMIDASVYIERLVRESLERSLSQFDDWWGEHKNEMRLDNSVAFSVEMEVNPRDKNQLGYEWRNRLTWDDFQAPPDRLSLALAATYGNLGVRYSSQTKDGKTTVSIIITPSFQKNKSWVKKGATDEVLLHEQLHFDISLIEACKLVQNLQQATITLENLENEVNKHYDEAQENITRLQAQYDSETNHGIIKAKQKQWSDRVLKELNNVNCWN